jgi:hypothetical protein
MRTRERERGAGRGWSIRPRHCAGCGRLFEPSEYDNFFCGLHCTLKDMGEECKGPCLECSCERLGLADKAVHGMAVDSHARAVVEHHEHRDAGWGG